MRQAKRKQAKGDAQSDERRHRQPSDATYAATHTPTTLPAEMPGLAEQQTYPPTETPQQTEKTEAKIPKPFRRLRFWLGGSTRP